MSSALTARRLAVVYAPLFAAVLIVLGFFFDPAIGDSGRKLAKVYAAHPGREQVSAVALHFAFAALAVPAVALIVSVRGRGAWLANVAGLLAFFGLTTLPGFLLTDFYDIAIYGKLGANGWQAVDDRLGELPGAAFMFGTAFVGFVFALPAALLAAWRGGLLPWWPAAAVLVGAISARALPGGFGLLVWAAALAALTWALRSRSREPAYLVP